ncbi:MAG TPA: tellurite resistance TerB family protein [Candidatus Polarisedimenticolia bacterium]|nr:tellurite resistance TerB family protein [Candidatus Polarisedimenticolia bacterium]
MEISRLTDQQRRALLDLLILAMYADGRLDLEEDARIQRLLAGMGYETEYDRDKQLDESITRLRNYSQNPQVARTRAVELAKSFTDPEQCRGVYQLLEQQANSDNSVVPAEHEFLSAVRKALQL